MSTIEAMEEAEKYLVTQWEFDGKICQEGLNLITNLRAAIEREREREKVFEQMREASKELIYHLTSIECWGENEQLIQPVDDLTEALAAAERVEKGE